MNVTRKVRACMVEAQVRAEWGPHSRTILFLQAAGVSGGWSSLVGVWRPPKGRTWEKERERSAVWH